jgi:uncharacterized protein YbjQ (UPF0145 family)
MSDSTADAPTQVERIRRGGLPDSALDRLAELRGDGMTSSFFSVPAFAVGAAGGVQPVGQVVGACAGDELIGSGYDTRERGPTSAGGALGPQWQEWDGPVRSWATVRNRAVARLIAQAEALGADIVLGVTVRREPQERRSSVIGLVLTGTAARVDAPPAKPVAALTSPQEFTLLRRAGTDVVGLVGAFASVDIRLAPTTSRALSPRRRLPSQELDDLTTGLYELRRLVMGRLRADAHQLGATGVIAVDLDDTVVHLGEGDPDCEMSVHAWGTAVRRRGAGIAPRSVLGAGR